MGGQYSREGPELLVIGSASRDLTPDDARGWRLGGGVSYGALTAARLGIRTAAIVGVDAPAAGAEELRRLDQAGVDVVLAGLDRAPIFVNAESPAGRIQQCVEPGLPLHPSLVPASWREAPAWLFAPVADELPDAWANEPPADAFVALGWQGLLRTLVAGEAVQRRAPRPSPLVRRADVIGVSAEDLADDVELRALVRLMRPGATLLLTRGLAGGLVLRADEAGRPGGRSWPAVPAGPVVDPTGAGDTFLAAYVASHLGSRSAADRRRGADLRFAAAAASLVVEGPGLSAVPDLADVHTRLAAVAGPGARPPRS